MHSQEDTGIEEIVQDNTIQTNIGDITETKSKKVQVYDSFMNENKEEEDMIISEKETIKSKILKILEMEISIKRERL